MNYWDVVGPPGDPTRTTMTAAPNAAEPTSTALREDRMAPAPRHHLESERSRPTQYPLVLSPIMSASSGDLMTPTDAHFSRTNSPYMHQPYTPERRMFQDPPTVEPASPHTSAAWYSRTNTYPNPNNVEHSHAAYHPTLFNTGASQDPSEYADSIAFAPRYDEEDYDRQRGREGQIAFDARADHQLAARGRAPSPEEKRAYLQELEGGNGVRRVKSSGSEADVENLYELVTVAGRQVPRRPCVYGLPIDEEEKTRLDIGHQMIVMAQPGLFLGPVREVLDPSTSKKQKRILDIGTGNGSWAVEVANMYLGALIDVVDLVPLKREWPGNVTFYKQDVIRGLPRSMENGVYDLVHARNIQLGIPDYPALIDECARVLKRGGLLNLIEGDWDIFDSDGNPVTPYKNPGWFNWIQAWRDAVARRNIDLDAPKKTEQWLKDSPYFSEVKAAARWMPIGPWTNAADAEMNRLGEIVWENLKYLIPSIRPLLTDHYGAEYADMIVQHAWAELASPHSHVFMRWRFFWAKRNTRPYNQDGPINRKPRKGKAREKAVPAQGSGPATS
ncbi:S-adenosyl-L-methionine-dependent methyltransferase [Calocera cornea HHB12733]|uniref:S-adenosyl-L-methionine-dependent methyltransferase n=1 Tax=Calocera cornea HHB12733 TaxID=1353952 RepID=A0A165CA23_9BASI|nr:S-adenosyl-L-methionine-dependent methyltransferase [Calocera cornea HHB12733]